MRENVKCCENSYYVFCIKLFAFGGDVLSETGALSGEYLTFLCHECSDINSSSGEACVLRARVEDKVAVFKLGCVKGYKLPTTELDRKAAGVIILPDELEFEPDFYIVASDVARRNFNKVLSSPLWVVNCATYEIPEEERQAEIEYYARRVKRAKALKEFRLREAIEEAHAITTLAANCTNETDPLRRIGWVR